MTTPTQYQQLCELMMWCAQDIYNATGAREDVVLRFDPEDGLYHASILYFSTKLRAHHEDALEALETLHQIIGRTIIAGIAENIELDRIHALEDAQLHALEEAGQ